MKKKSRPSGLIFQENMSLLAAPLIPPPLLLFVVIPVSSLFFNNNELTRTKGMAEVLERLPRWSNFLGK